MAAFIGLLMIIAFGAGVASGIKAAIARHKEQARVEREQRTQRYFERVHRNGEGS